MDRLARIREELGMEVVGLACDTGGPLVAPGGAQRIMAPLKDTLATAQKLGCRQIIAQVGNELKDVPRAQQHANCVEAFRAAAPLCEDAGVTLSRARPQGEASLWLLIGTVARSWGKRIDFAIGREIVAL